VLDRERRRLVQFHDRWRVRDDDRHVPLGQLDDIAEPALVVAVEPVRLVLGEVCRPARRLVGRVEVDEVAGLGRSRTYSKSSFSISTASRTRLAVWIRSAITKLGFRWRPNGTLNSLTAFSRYSPL
jgi:hypothetical protein